VGLNTDPTAQRAPADTILVLFGTSGDLAARKLLPGLFHLFAEDALPGRFRLLAVSRRPLDDDDVREHARRAIEEFGRRSTEGWDSFAVTVSSARSGDDGDLVDKLASLRRELPDAQVLFYLSVPPEGAEAVIDELAGAGLTGDAKVILEKPFGEDLQVRPLAARRGRPRLLG
jgi:glucose-6-phosphate 1-dehydrogenase